MKTFVALAEMHSRDDDCIMWLLELINARVCVLFENLVHILMHKKRN